MNSSSTLGVFALLQATNSYIYKCKKKVNYIITQEIFILTVCSVKNVMTSVSFFNTGCLTIQFIKRDKP